ncbi:N-alpha-acetyltransferase, non-catalitic subunit [Coemansia spiralis]|uniref:N-alpha-acetyltransferase, non-catalitic subunit n=2 Tax=Coemansia TaxID=4863 RepID=A0A9W8G370_9FUNG|nr:Mak10 subunit, NatC N-terminal acetyltransferase-domain-containing protein [Coemansia spiralis]KAJ1988011.1 N-alpha-acetyltransferase, non-catalitic subunit [Coemansia umbellata]KAJ2619977.1 N-alpha-acetyltransferase, non-catalitic subunit [Coemansia sp. RSA 1358]KAJ2672404.1 N-alpha-acetyltransferase, non-catalitic subunit [Coemansia spiralis]
MDSEVIVDESGLEWIDITDLLVSGARELEPGELLKPTSLTLFDAMSAVQVMDPRLDMGMLSAEDEAAIAQWDINRELTLADTLWILNQLFCCEMTMHASSSLLQTILTCNYVTEPHNLIGKKDTGNPQRDLVLFPMVIAVGACCTRVWKEYRKENLYPEEDVHFGQGLGLHEYSLPQITGLLETAKERLTAVIGGDSEDSTEKRAAELILEQVEIRGHWLNVLEVLSAEYLIDDPSALERGSQELSVLKKLHAAHTTRLSKNKEDEIATVVPGVFDKKCMRKYSSFGPMRPRELMALAESHALFSSITDDLAMVKTMLAIESVEQLIHFFQMFARKESVPYVRSLVMSVFASEGRVQLMQPIVMFVRRAISEVAGPWDAIAAGQKGGGEKVDVFCTEAASLLLWFFKTLCQNPSRQRRLGLKYLQGWDSLQAEGEQLDIALYLLANPQAKDAGDPQENPFYFSSWAYHMKLLLMETSLLAGIRLNIYLDHEFPLIFCYLGHILGAHLEHLERMLALARKRNELSGSASRAQRECVGQLERWKVAVAAQKDMATAIWLLAHVLTRLGGFRAPWHGCKTQLAQEVCRAQETTEAQVARFALRFRAFAQLNSPTPLGFAEWQATCDQLDMHTLDDLFAHSSKLFAQAKELLERNKNMEFLRPLYFVVLSNAVSLAMVSKTPVAMRVSGKVALEYQRQLLGIADDAAARSKEKRKKRARQQAKAWLEDAGRALAELKVSWSRAEDKQPDWPIFSFLK